MIRRAQIACLVVALATTVRAQQPQPGADPLGEHLFPPELVMQHQKAIGLDDAQKTSIRNELRDSQGRFMELQWELQDAMETLLSLVKETQVDEKTLLRQLDTVLAAEREIKRTQITMLIRIKNTLRPEQQAELRQRRGSTGGQ